MVMGALMLAGASAGCVDVVPFVCADDSQCDRVPGARCFESGCATPDPDCESGFRYGDDTAAPGACVSMSGTSSTSSSSGAAEVTSSADSGSSSTSRPGTSTGSSGTFETSSSSSGLDQTSGTTGCEPGGCTCVEQLSVGNYYNCVVRDDGAVACWGHNARGQSGAPDAKLPVIAQPTVVDLEGNVAAEVAAHFDHSCARTDDGDVWCWGRNHLGMVDPGAPEEVNLAPQRVEGVSDATAVRVGLRSSCARHADDSLTCWGWDDYGLLLTEEATSEPVTSGPFEGMVDYQLGFYHGCYWTADDVWCWGRNNWGQVGVSPGSGEFAEPQAVPLPGTPQLVAVARNHACAVLEDGSVWCWGNNETNQIADGEPAEFPDPVQLEAPWTGSPARLFALNWHTCVETDRAELWCWGGIAAGWLGVEGVATNAPLWPPQRLAAADELRSPIEQIGVGQSHVCTLLDSGEVYCWGNASLWQIGPTAPPVGSDTVRVDPCDTM